MENLDAMFNRETQSGTRDKLPTLRQFLKSKGNRKIPRSFLVTVIWKPGEWDNFTLETESFRLRVNKGDEMYPLLDEFTADPKTADVPVAITICDRQKGTWMFIPSEEEGAWSEIGSNGLKWMA